MHETIYMFKKLNEKIVERVIDDEILEFFVVKSPNPRCYGGK